MCPLLSSSVPELGRSTTPRQSSKRRQTQVAVMTLYIDRCSGNPGAVCTRQLHFLPLTENLL